MTIQIHRGAVTVPVQLESVSMSAPLTNYQIFRGNCKVACEALMQVLPGLRLVRGHYRSEPHWWLKTPSGDIVDPTALQFDVPNVKQFYVEFNGVLECAHCGREVAEENAKVNGNYGFCSTRCAMRFVGL